MGRNEHSNQDPEDKRSTGRAAKRGHSGYGLESVRPHLRAQLQMHDLMRPTFPPPDQEDSSGDHPD